MQSHRIAVMAFAFAFAIESRIDAQQVDAVEHVLDNGMKFLLVVRPGEPNISAGWIAKVGSVHERPGITGTAHLFEHMMFKGTHVIGTKDAKRDLEIDAELDALKAEIRKEEHALDEAERLGAVADARDPAHRNDAHRALLSRLDLLTEEQRKIIVKDEFDRIYNAAGASGMNAGTTHDFTIYFISVPKNKLELWCWMESDRLRSPVFREFYTERDVVREERRLRVESTPTGKFEEQFDSLFWDASPYSWPVIGWPRDVEGITREEALTFFDLFYAPGNLTACLVGDFDVEAAKSLIERYFGRIPRGQRLPEPIRTREVPQLAEKRMNATAPTKPRVTIRYHTVPDGHRDEPALDVLAEILEGRTGRLYKELVEGLEVANSATARVDGRKYEGSFELSSIVKDGRTPEEAEAGLLGVIEKLGTELVSPREIQKVKNQLAASEFRKLRSSFSLMLQLLVRDSYRGWRSINTDPPLLQAVTAEDLRTVAQKYFTRENRSVLVFRTLEEEGEADPDADLFSTLGPEEVEQARQIRAQIRGMPREQIPPTLERLRPTLEAAPAEEAALIRVIVALLERRLAASENAASSETSPGGTPAPDAPKESAPEGEAENDGNEESRGSDR
jgi:predicted Zn-dependent peptidase